MSLQSRFKKSALPSPTVIPFAGPRLLTLKQAAEYINHSVDLVRDMVASRELPHIQKGGGKKRPHFVIDRLDLDKWIETKKLNTPGAGAGRAA